MEVLLGGSIILFSGTVLDRSYTHFIEESTETQRSHMSCTGSAHWLEFYFQPPAPWPYYSILSLGYFNHSILTYFPVTWFSPQTRESPRLMTTKMSGISLARGFGRSCTVHSQAECRVEPFIAEAALKATSIKLWIPANPYSGDGFGRILINTSS